MPITNHGNFVTHWEKTEWCNKCGLFKNGACTYWRDCYNGEQFEWPELTESEMDEEIASAFDKYEVAKKDHLNAPVKCKEMYVNGKKIK